MGKKRKAKESGTKYWKCLQCGKDGQDISRGTCEECGRDLNIYGEAYETGESPSPTPLPWKKIKKICIAVAAVIAVVVSIFAALMFFGNKSYEPTVTTTTEPPTTVPTTMAYQSNAVFPDFLEFANGFATIYEDNKDNGEITYKMSVDDASSIMEEYVDLLLSDYAFKELYEGSRKYCHGFEYIGTEKLDTFNLTFSTGDADEEKYTDLNFSINNYREDGTEYIIVRYVSGLISESTTKRTTYSETKVAPLSIPDFELFANGYGPKIKSVTNSSNNLISVYYEIRKDELLDDYIELLESNYNFKLVYDEKNYNWKGFRYTGSEQLESFNTVLNVIDGTQKEYANNHLTAYVFNDTESGKRTIKFEYSRDLDVVDPIRKTTVS